MKHLITQRIQWCIALLLTAGTGAFAQHSTAALELLKDGSSCKGLQHRLSNTRWNMQAGPLYSLSATGAVKPQLHIRPLEDGQLLLTLSIQNTGSDTVTVSPVFPLLQQLAPERMEGQLHYLFPRQGAMPAAAETAMEALYSGNFPLQFMDVYHPAAGGFFILCRDTTNYPKRFALSKKNGRVDMQVSYRSRTLAPGEVWTLPAVSLGAHAGDWHDALTAYRRWLQSWYQPQTPRKQWFRDVYNFRQVFLHPIFGDPGAFDRATGNIDLESEVSTSRQAFGGVDYVHIFDWSQTPQHGRVGDYDPWGYLGGKAALQEQVRRLQAAGIPVGIYHEGYLLSKVSRIAQQYGKEWQQLDTNGVAYTRFGDEYLYPCPLVKDWQRYITATVQRTAAVTGATGVYLDQLGFGWQYGCYNPAHGHDVRRTALGNALQVPAEAQLMKMVKLALPPGKVTYTEEMPTDVSTRHQDGSFTYAVAVAGDPANNNPARINLARFAIPGFKLFEILHVDAPMGYDTTGVKQVFFNGEGLWLEGPVRDTAWFPEPLRQLIRKTHGLLTRYKTAFRSNDPMPDVPVMADGVKANLFPGQRQNVWTLFNTNAGAYTGKVLAVPHKRGARYYDAWNGRKLQPVIEKGHAVMSLQLRGNDAGCVVQEY